MDIVRDVGCLDRAIALHRLWVKPDRSPIKPALRRMHPDLAAKLEAEVDKLVTSDFIQEV